MRYEDEALRLRALSLLGEFGDSLARGALENGALDVEADVLSWQGSRGTVRGHRVVVRVPFDLWMQVASNLVAREALTQVVAAAMAERENESLADLRVEEGIVVRARAAVRSPYRDPG